MGASGVLGNTAISVIPGFNDRAWMTVPGPNTGDTGSNTGILALIRDTGSNSGYLSLIPGISGYLSLIPGISGYLSQ